MPGCFRPETFAARVRDLAGACWNDDARIAVAVSGGADSLALLGLARAAFGPARLAALTVDHGLRAGSAAEAAAVAALCSREAILHATLRPADPLPAAALQAAARDARYALMAGWCRAHAAPLLLTAHHADDQAETLMMRLSRGAGLSGLAGIRASRDLGGVLLLRPLLDTPRAALGAALPPGWTPADDPSNRDPRFERTRARALLAAGWPAARQAAASAAHLAEADAALRWMTARAMAGCVAEHAGALLIDPAGLPPELLRRLILACLARLAPRGAPEPRGADVRRLLARATAGRTSTLAGVQLRPLPDGRWRMKGVAPPRATARLDTQREES